jgi:hypothetical protein
MECFQAADWGWSMNEEQTKLFETLKEKRNKILTTKCKGSGKGTCYTCILRAHDCIEAFGFISDNMLKALITGSLTE